MKKISCLILGLLASSVYANVYVDGNVGIATSSNNLAISLDGGYMVNQFLGLEGGYTGTSGYSVWDGAVKGVLPIGGVVDLYGKLGLGIPTCDGCNTGLLYGAGVGFHIAPSWQLHVEDYAVSGAGNPNFLMFGAHFAF
ncbi:MAG: hypothetical protein EKK57_09615 [Proteobacteria bacterium]|nr:MAG: hypothetical protein EKK57_09615 [Pseudomonadota bacterium]